MDLLGLDTDAAGVLLFGAVMELILAAPPATVRGVEGEWRSPFIQSGRPESRHG